jgi:hypothetical protein
MVEDRSARTIAHDMFMVEILSGGMVHGFNGRDLNSGGNSSPRPLNRLHQHTHPPYALRAGYANDSVAPLEPLREQGSPNPVTQSPIHPITLTPHHSPVVA